jgi:putative ABC transport system permease protein
LVLTVVTGLLAGSYPAFYLSSFRPIAVLKGSIAAGMKSGPLRNGLVIFQFALSTILIMGTLVIYKQLQYIRSKDLGYKKEQLLVVQNTYILGDKARVATFKNEILKQTGVISGSASGFLPIISSRTDNTFFTEGSIGSQENIMMQDWEVDSDYIRTFGMKVIKGRNFDPSMLTDSSTIIINESAARLLGYEDPINKFVYQPDFEKPNELRKRQIIGVIKDFHFASLRTNITPLCLGLKNNIGAVTFKIDGTKANEIIRAIGTQWKQMAPEQPFSYKFVDESFEQMYRAEQRSGKLLAVFAGFAIFIACLGLFGLVTYAAEQRTKEIGIRKVLGATISNVITLLSRDFLKLVAFSLLIAVPLSWYAMNKWLDEFAYKITISWWLFAVAGGTALLIAILTISLQALKAAVANPIKSLRTE